MSCNGQRTDAAAGRGANLGAVNFINAKLDGATITDACLWETRRAGWSIEGMVCEAVYWDQERIARTTYAPGEFERLHADKTTLVLEYPGGMSPIEVATLPLLMKELAEGCVLRFQRIEDAPGGAKVTLVVDEPGDHDITELKAKFERRGQHLIRLGRKRLEDKHARECAERELNEVYKKLGTLYLEHPHEPPQQVFNNPTIYGPVAGEISGEVTYTHNDLDALKRFVDTYNIRRAELPLTPDDAASLDDYVTAINTALAAPTPNHSIIHETVETVRDILNGMSGSIAATGLLEMLKGLV